MFSTGIDLNLAYVDTVYQARGFIVCSNDKGMQQFVLSEVPILVFQNAERVTTIMLALPLHHSTLY